MIRRCNMDDKHHYWGQNKAVDRERAKAIRDHAGSGNTEELVEVEIGAEVTAESISYKQIDRIVDLLFQDARDVGYHDNREMCAVVYNFLTQRGDL
jgi:hypothetical protein